MQLVDLYQIMARARAFELAQAELWRAGHISGEMHLGTGEEAIVAGVVAQMKEGDAVALDHRATPVLTALGVDLVAMLKEMLGEEDGLCGGCGGHMHLFSREHLAASSGIVGAAGPTACGFALAAKQKRSGSVAVAFFGDGAINQGMLLESFNLAVAWELPLLFICKDNGWAATTRSEKVSGGTVVERARGFGLKVESVDGLDPELVQDAAGRLLERARAVKGPGLLHAKCIRGDGHFLNDPMLRMAKSPIEEGGEVFKKVLSAMVSTGGGGLGARASSMVSMMDLLRRARRKSRDSNTDPLVIARKKLKKQQSRVEEIDQSADREVAEAVQQALGAEVPR